MNERDATRPARPLADRVRAHLEICRFDHWFKNVFVLPGCAVALAFEPDKLTLEFGLRLLLGLLSIGLVASSNYTINEILDAPYDRLHPEKLRRAVPSGRVSVPWAYVQWIGLALAGIGLGAMIARSFAVVAASLFAMGCLYNIPPIRTKELPYVDVLSESVNNPLRMLAGWFVVGPDAFAPASLLISYWMGGAYFMAMKRFAEYRHLGDPALAAAYRRSFRYYDETRLLVSIMFYASACMLTLGAFIVRYRIALILSTPFVALVMAQYLKIGLQPDSPVQNPEQLYREKSLMIPLCLCTAAVLVFLFVDVSGFAQLLAPTAPTDPAYLH